MVKLGMKGRDKLTGFEGVCLGVAQYLTGCDQILLVPDHTGEHGKRPDGEWFDDMRIERVGDKIVKFSNDDAAAAEKPGCDEAAPPTR
jgi:hypothetical protein